jgi:hypothetical protein
VISRHHFELVRLFNEALALIPIESRLEEVNRQNLKFITLNTHYKPGLALELNSSSKRGKTNQTRIKASEHDNLFYRGSVPKNLVLIEEVTKTESI